MYNHGKYSKNKTIRPYVLVVTTKRYDGDYEDCYYFETKEKAQKAMEIEKQNEPKPNEYYFGTEYKIKYIGNERVSA